MTTTKGELQIDYDRGVIWFNSEEGGSRLRICRLPKPIPEDGLLDITHMFGQSWGNEPNGKNL